MDPALLDTDILSEVLKAKNPNVIRHATEYRKQFGRYTTSAITITEIVKGFHKAGREDRIQSLLAGVVNELVLPLELQSALIGGRIYAELEKTGQTIGRADPPIAGIALVNDLVRVTGNTEHFARIVTLGFPLKLANWRT